MFWRKGYKLIEVDRTQERLPEITPELREGLTSLAANPFLKVITTRLRYQRAALKTALETTRFAKTEDTAFVQLGVFWTGWLEREIARLTEAPERPSLQAMTQEEEAFKEIDAMLERVGIEEQPQS